VSQIDRLNAALAGRYRIEHELGAGGMATVYLAEDLKHDRKVAVKVLKPELAAVLGAERFVQEIKTTAALQHPHILPLFDSGTADGFLYYVMPYIQGETLRDRLNRETQLGVDEAIKIAVEVADALHLAHSQGVIHRDIKPENILLANGRPMVADFGIALAVSAAAGGRMTETGLSLGTPHYMSPEQATAEKEITARSDVYSLASVLFEMLAGQPPHIGGSAQQVIMKIIAEPVDDVTKFRKSVPPHVAAAVARALEKLPADRFESAKAFADALGNPAYAHTVGGRSAAHGRQVRAASSAATVAFAGIALIATIGWVWSALGSGSVPVKRTRFVVVVPDSIRPRPDSPGQNFAISPDGSELTYLGGAASPQLYRRRLDELVSTPITGTVGAGQVRYSPDGEWVAFVQGGQLKKIPRAGGPSMVISDSVNTFTWGDGDRVVFAKRGGLWQVNGAGGPITPLAAPDPSSSQQFYWPFLLPGGDALLFDIVTAGDQANAQLAAMRLDDRKVMPLGLTGRNPRFLPSGHVIFGRLDGTVIAAPFDPKTLRVTGPAVTVLENVFIKGGGAGEFGVADDGTLFYVQGNSEGEVLVVDHSGNARVLLSERRSYSRLRYSPTSGRIVFQMADRSSFSKTDIWLYDDLTRTTTRLTNDGASTAPAWMADGERVVWIYADSSGRHIRRQRWDGAGAPETLFPDERNVQAITPSPTGKAMLLEKTSGFGDLYVADDETSSLRPLAVTPSGEGGARISPDGKWVAYFSDESGQREVFVIALSGDGGRRQISTDGGSEPAWAPDGKTLYYRAGGNWIAAGIVTTPSFAVTQRAPLFPDRFRRTGTSAGYDVSRDGRSFVVVGDGTEGSQRIVVVTGWLDELRERMSPGQKR
jgi:Tol biopolymer transport system component